MPGDDLTSSLQTRDRIRARLEAIDAELKGNVSERGRLALLADAGDSNAQAETVRLARRSADLQSERVTQGAALDEVERYIRRAEAIMQKAAAGEREAQLRRILDERLRIAPEIDATLKVLADLLKCYQQTGLEAVDVFRQVARDSAGGANLGVPASLGDTSVIKTIIGERCAVLGIDALLGQKIGWLGRSADDLVTVERQQQTGFRHLLSKGGAPAAPLPPLAA